MSDDNWGRVLLYAPEVVSVMFIIVGTVVQVVSGAIRSSVGMWRWRRRAWPRRIS